MKFEAPMSKSLRAAVNSVQRDPLSVVWITEEGQRIAAIVHVDMVPVLAAMAKRRRELDT
jgi:hypothetical protein